MKNFINRALAAKKRIYFVMAVCAACLLTSCKGMYVPYSYNVLRNSTEVVLSQANFRVVRNVEAVVEINNSRLRRADVEESAFAELMRQYPLTGSQTYTNVVFEEIRREGRHAKQYIAVRAVIIEFVSPNGQAIPSVQYVYLAQPAVSENNNSGQIIEDEIPYPTPYPTPPTEIEELAKKLKNRYYMALLFKTRMIDTTKLKQIANLFDYNHIEKMAQQFTLNDLKRYSQGYDKIFEQFAIQ